MFPEAFIKRIREQNYINPKLLFESLNDTGPISIRINPGKWNKVPEGAEHVPWCRTGYYLPGKPSFTADPLFHAGCYYPQEASGMFIEEIFNNLFVGQTDLRVLDLCGAPGSKSTHLSSLIGNNGCLITNEVIRSRADILAENITRWGVPNSIVTNNDPRDIGKLTGYFDLIIADVPCSGEGMFRNNNVRNQWSENNAHLCTTRQRRIISDIWPALKENGILIYSTCTFNPAENEENIKWLTDNTLSECLKIDISAFPGITEITFKGITGYGFYPYKIKGEGFFISVLRKIEKTPEFRIKKHTNPGNLSQVEIKTVEELIGKEKRNILKINDIITDIPLEPNEYSTLSSMLRVIKPGTELFRISGKGVVPHHSLAMSVNPARNIFPIIELNYSKAVRYLRKDNLDLPVKPNGWYMAVFKGCNLGFLKSTGGRFNNYFPVSLRIKMGREIINEKQIIKWETD